jgi:hypothetical protein
MRVRSTPFGSFFVIPQWSVIRINISLGHLTAVRLDELNQLPRFALLCRSCHAGIDAHSLDSEPARQIARGLHDLASDILSRCFLSAIAVASRALIARTVCVETRCRWAMCSTLASGSASSRAIAR